MSQSSEAAASGASRPDRRGSGAAPTFHERLYASWWTWPLPVLAAALLAAEVHMGYPGIRAWLPYVVLIPAAVAVPLWLSRTVVSVRDGELWAGDAHVPLRFVADAEVIPRSDKQRALGPELDPAAFIVHRPWAATAVRVWLDDADDPTPYWIVSTRHPERLVDALVPDGADDSDEDPGTAD